MWERSLLRASVFSVIQGPVSGQPSADCLWLCVLVRGYFIKVRNARDDYST